MTNGEKSRDEILQYNIDRKTAKILALSSGETDKFEKVMDEEAFPFDQRQMIEQAKFIYCPLGKAFEQQTSITKDKGKKLRL